MGDHKADELCDVVIKMVERIIYNNGTECGDVAIRGGLVWCPGINNSWGIAPLRKCSVNAILILPLNH